jgi:hypothetical protein
MALLSRSPYTLAFPFQFPRRIYCELSLGEAGRPGGRTFDAVVDRVGVSFSRISAFSA